MIGGSLHYKHKYREELTITTEKPLEKPLTVVLASDLHVGYHNRREELARWIDLINRENPDLVLFGGDIVDRSLRPVLAGDYAAEFRRIQAPVLAIPGNHEYYCDMEGSKQFYATAGIRLLRDSVCTCQGITIIGRDDRNNPQRKSLAALADSLQGFTILLDHQPFNLEEAEEAGIDFQFSGHTHHGRHVREILGASHAREHPLLRKFRLGDLGRENPYRHPVGVSGFAYQRRVI
jgi:hypothetical protein